MSQVVLGQLCAWVTQTIRVHAHSCITVPYKFQPVQIHDIAPIEVYAALLQGHLQMDVIRMFFVPILWTKHLDLSQFIRTGIGAS